MFHFKTKNEEMSEIAHPCPHPLSDLLDGDSEKALNDDEDEDSRSSSPSKNSPIRQRLSDRFRKRSIDSNSESQSESKSGLLRDLKGRIVKTVEEKISEYKHDKRGKAGPPSTKQGEKELLDINESLSEKLLEESLCIEDPELENPATKVSSSPKESYLSSFKDRVYHLSNIEELKRKRLKLGPSAVQGLPTEDKDPPPEIETGMEAGEREQDLTDFKDPVDESADHSFQQADILESQPAESEELSVVLVPRIHPSIITQTVSYVNDNLPLLSTVSGIHYYLAASLAVLVLILPSFLSGFVIGLTISVIILINFEPQKPKPPQRLEVQKFEPIFEHQEQVSQEEWFFELPGEYDPVKFRSSLLVPVHLELKESVLTIMVPKRKFKLSRQQEYGEEIKTPGFIQRRTFSLKGARVGLLPKNLSGLRVWSKRYPIQILFPERHLVKEEKLNSSSSFYGDFHEPGSKEYGEFELVEEETYEEKSLVLFARTDRAKDKWLRLLSGAAVDGSTEEDVPEVPKVKLDYVEYMRSLLLEKPQVSSDPQNLLWFNALMGRVMYDFLTKEKWKLYVKTKLERKLAKIKFPQFMGDVKIADIDLGKTVPVVLSVGEPVIDRETGLWIDLDIEYEGGFQMSIETKLNMLKIADKECEMSEMAHRPESFSDSGSDDEEFCDLESETQRVIASASEEQRTSKIGSVFDKITQSKYFQQASEHKYVRKALEGVSGLRLMLQVEVCSLRGKLVLNIPPPPTDRLWYGFRFPPELSLKAVPKAGERTLTIGLVTDWIEKQLVKEFENVFVLPNMDEQNILLMDAGDLYST